MRLGAISKTTELSQFISKANHSISKQSKPVPQPLMLKKLTLIGSMKTIKPFRTNTKKRCPIHQRGLECKSRKSRDTWSINRQFGLGVQNKAGQRLTEFCQKNTLVIANTLFQQHKRQFYTWISPNGRYQNQIGYILCSQKWRSSLQSAKQDLKLTEAQIISSLLQNSGLN